jgi:RNA polymerase sigma-70 factor (ECF subfamily)
VIGTPHASIERIPLSMPPNDQREFEALLEAQLTLAFSVAFRALGSREEAEDVVQNAAIRAWKGFDAYERGTNFKAWFLKIVVNLALNARRDATRRPATVEVEDEEEAGFLYSQTRAAGTHDQGEPATAFLAKLQSQDIQDALSRLPGDFRIVAVLHFVEELSYEEIAGIVGCPLGTVRSRLYRARRLLQRELWDTAREMGIAPKTEPEKKPKSHKSFSWVLFSFFVLLSGTMAVWRVF